MGDAAVTAPGGAAVDDLLDAPFRPPPNAKLRGNVVLTFVAGTSTGVYGNCVRNVPYYVADDLGLPAAFAVADHDALLKAAEICETFSGAELSYEHIVVTVPIFEIHYLVDSRYLRQERECSLRLITSQPVSSLLL